MGNPSRTLLLASQEARVFLCVAVAPAGGGATDAALCAQGQNAVTATAQYSANRVAAAAGAASGRFPRTGRGGGGQWGGLPLRCRRFSRRLVMVGIPDDATEEVIGGAPFHCAVAQPTATNLTARRRMVSCGGRIPRLPWPKASADHTCS